MGRFPLIADIQGATDWSLTLQLVATDAPAIRQGRQRPSAMLTPPPLLHFGQTRDAFNRR